MDSRQIWKELKNLGICTGGSVSSHNFSNEKLNLLFAGMAFGPAAPTVTGFFDSLPADENYFPAFSFKEVSLNEVQKAVTQSISQARGYDGIPQSIILITLPNLGPYIVRIFNDSLKTSFFPLRVKNH